MKSSCSQYQQDRRKPQSIEGSSAQGGGDRTLYHSNTWYGVIFQGPRRDAPVSCERCVVRCVPSTVLMHDASLCPVGVVPSCPAEVESVVPSCPCIEHKSVFPSCPAEVESSLWSRDISVFFLCHRKCQYSAVSYNIRFGSRENNIPLWYGFFAF